VRSMVNINLMAKGFVRSMVNINLLAKGVREEFGKNYGN
jgi:hypothetical protein